MLEKRKAIYRYHAFNARVANDGPHTRITDSCLNSDATSPDSTPHCPRRCCLPDRRSAALQKNGARALTLPLPVVGLDNPIKTNVEHSKKKRRA